MQSTNKSKKLSTTHYEMSYKPVITQQSIKKENKQSSNSKTFEEFTEIFSSLIGQNVNKRETAVRAIHIPTNLSVHVSSERSQLQNRERAVELLSSKVHILQEAATDEEKKSMYISKTTQAEWGNQIRSYVLHPYKMVKDHRTDVETAKVDAVLERGELDEFIDAEKNL
jgi:protein subunit release factor A